VRKSCNIRVQQKSALTARCAAMAAPSGYGDACTAASRRDARSWPNFAVVLWAAGSSQLNRFNFFAQNWKHQRQQRGDKGERCTHQGGFVDGSARRTWRGDVYPAPSSRLFSGTATIGHPVPTDASPALVKAVLRVSALPGLYSSHKSWTFFTAMKLVMPYLGHPDALERAVAVTKSRSCRRIQTCGGHWRSSPIWLGPCY